MPMKRTATLLLLACTFILPLAAATAWEAVDPPHIDTVDVDGTVATVSFTMKTGPDGADKGLLQLFKDGSLVAERPLGRSGRDSRDEDFTLASSGDYTVRIQSERRKEAAVKTGEDYRFSFSLPLEEPSISLMNQGAGVISLSLDAVSEAEAYTLQVTSEDGSLIEERAITPGQVDITSVPVGQRALFSVTATRGADSSTSSQWKTSREAADRQWSFAWFGQSTKDELNRVEVIDADDLTIKLYSTAYDDKGTTTAKGGKFTAFHDGISYYYTVFDPDEENFVLSATFTVDYINPVADGQEGFGILAMDSLGSNGVSSINHYTNSAGIIATKFEETIDGTKHTSKDTLGARFVTGLSDEVIAGGDAAIAEQGKSVSHAYSYDQSALVKSGDVYRLTLVKDNTGYHAILRQEIASEDSIEEYILYDPAKLEVLDPDRSYVGFAVARGCNVTVSDISFTTSDPASDPPAVPEPDELVPLDVAIDSPSSSSSAGYDFVFTVNADGWLHLESEQGAVIVDKAQVKAFEDFIVPLELEDVINNYRATFTPDPAYRPGEKMTMAQYDPMAECYVEDYSPVTLTHSITRLSFPGEKLYVSPSGSIFGDGSKADPLDLDSALRYSAPGQVIVLPAGRWTLYDPIIIERGNSGRQGEPKTLTCEDGRCVFDFAPSGGGGIQLWGDWWVIENVDITRTGDNTKGLQVAGDYNIIRGVRAYECGDTGIQISGTSSETWDKWPHDNLVSACESHDNADSAGNNADGFAAKLTAGPGNVFADCIAHHNIDDGWDLYSKIETGPIGEVLIVRCVAYGNGSLSDGSGKGDGNGFKLGGDGIAVLHQVRDSVAYSNGQAGITSNSNPSLIVSDVTLYGNGGSNLALYGKGGGGREYVLSGILSVNGGAEDDVEEAQASEKEGVFLYNGATTMDGSGRTADESVFESVDNSIIPRIDENGCVDMQGLFKVIEPSLGAGSRL